MSTTAHRTPGETFAGYTQLVTMVCGNCGITFAMPEAKYDECDRDHSKGWYCPNGHSRVFIGRTPEQKLIAERERSARLAAERDQADARARAQKAAATRARNERNKARKRSADGVCPCCGRTFKQLVRHMASKHPDFDPMAAS